jgi:hypothetical protein
MLETSIPLPTGRSYLLSVESAFHRWRILQLFEHTLPSGMRTAPASRSAGDIDRRRNYLTQSSHLRMIGGWANDAHPGFT